MSASKNQIGLLLALLLCISWAVVSNYDPLRSIANQTQTEIFNDQLKIKELLAEKTLITLQDKLKQQGLDAVGRYPFPENDISYYIYQNKELTFWSDNNIESSNLIGSKKQHWSYALLPNAHVVYRIIKVGATNLMAVIKIKNNFPFQNQNLKNDFASDFHLDKEIEIKVGQKTDPQVIVSKDGNYLFSLISENRSNTNRIVALSGLIAAALSIFIFFFIYATAPRLFNREGINLKVFAALLATVGTALGYLLWNNIPALVFKNSNVSPYDYAAPPFLSSIHHLTISTLFFLASAYLFYFFVKSQALTRLRMLLLLAVAMLGCFAGFFYVLHSLIFHSSISIHSMHLNNFSFTAIYIHLLLLLWGIGLALFCMKIQNSFHQINKTKVQIYIIAIISILSLTAALLMASPTVLQFTLSYFVFSTLSLVPLFYKRQLTRYEKGSWFVLLFTLILIPNTLYFENHKKVEKYKVLAQNRYSNGTIENDKMAIEAFQELEAQLSADKKIGEFSTKQQALEEYINKTYLRGFWNKFDMQLGIVKENSDKQLEYNYLISKFGTPLNATHFHTLAANKNNIAYLGAFSFQSKTVGWCYYLEFYPRTQFKSYSYPNLLKDDVQTIENQLNIAYASYQQNNLIFNSGDFNYPNKGNWIEKKGGGFYKTSNSKQNQYIYHPIKNSYSVITELEIKDAASYLGYCTYTFIELLMICWVLIWIHALLCHQQSFKPGLITRVQYAFIILLIISFISIFYVQVNFIQQKYKAQQITDLENKKEYVQKSLQEKYYWTQNLSQINRQLLNLDLQDLSYLFHTDIHIYDNMGVLIGSSQPLLFSKKVLSSRISPTPFFTMNKDMYQYEKIGTLNYLTAYSNFYNGDYLQIGFIAIPHFFSQAEIHKEIEDFLAIILNIYIIIISLAVIMSLFIGKQLSSPLKMLEIKLKEMRIDRRNEKIEYKFKDEIGQLVEQYNLTVEELENSARKLAQSERETAWKTMAKQVAHEINNPLTPIKLTIQQLLRMKELKDDRFDDYFKKSTITLIEQIDNLANIASTFSNFARMPEANFKVFDITEKLNSVIQLFKNNYEQIEINYHPLENALTVYGDKEQMTQVFNNLILNAIQAIPNDRMGKITIRIQRNEHQIELEIQDNGDGIPPEAYDKLFIPNFTTKNRGMGLGLALAKNFVEHAGGSISFCSKVNEGTSFFIKLPLQNS